MNNRRPAIEEAREQRIDNEAIVDCHEPHEAHSGWFYYMDGRLNLPCTVRCIETARGCPLKVGDEASMTELLLEDRPTPFEAIIQWKGDEISVPLAILEVIDGPEEGREAVADWRYWVSMGREF